MVVVVVVAESRAADTPCPAKRPAGSTERLMSGARVAINAPSTGPRQPVTELHIKFCTEGVQFSCRRRTLNSTGAP